MRKLLLCATLLIAITLALPPLVSKEGPWVLPPGTKAGTSWVRINDSLALMIDSPRTAGPSAPRGAVTGRLMAKVEGKWVAVDLGQDPLRFLPAR